MWCALWNPDCPGKSRWTPASGAPWSPRFALTLLIVLKVLRRFLTSLQPSPVVWAPLQTFAAPPLPHFRPCFGIWDLREKQWWWDSCWLDWESCCCRGLLSNKVNLSKVQSEESKWQNTQTSLIGYHFKIPASWLIHSWHKFKNNKVSQLILPVWQIYIRFTDTGSMWIYLFF